MFAHARCQPFSADVLKSQNGTYPVRRKVLTVHIHIAAKHIDHERNLFIVPI